MPSHTHTHTANVSLPSSSSSFSFPSSLSHQLSFSSSPLYPFISSSNFTSTHIPLVFQVLFHLHLYLHFHISTHLLPQSSPLPLLLYLNLSFPSPLTPNSFSLLIPLSHHLPLHIYLPLRLHLHFPLPFLPHPSSPFPFPTFRIPSEHKPRITIRARSQIFPDSPIGKHICALPSAISYDNCPTKRNLHIKLRTGRM